MYYLKIKTKFNNLELIVDDYHDEEVQDILNQPYIEDVYLCNIAENKKENYPKKAYRNNKWYVYDSTTWNMESPYYTLKVLSNMLIKSNADAIRDSAFFNYSGWARNNQTTVTYQDNHTDAMELRIYDKKWDKYSIECGFNDYGEINKIFYKNFTYSGYINHPSYSNSFYALGFYPVISYSEK